MAPPPPRLDHPGKQPAPARPAATPTRVVVLGSTGSIGVNALAVIAHLNAAGHRRLEVVGLAAGTNVSRLAQQIKSLTADGPAPALAIADPDAEPEAFADLGRGVGPVFTGPDAAERLIEHCRADVVVAAIVGIAGLPATLAAVEQGCTVALANKETLVAAGALVMQRAADRGATLLPVDSEHSAVFQCLAAVGDPVAAGRMTPRPFRRITLTASGGPFRETPLAQMQRATPEQALNHPTWDMGRKISIDSATMMNKALELIEAHHLFGAAADQLDVLIHPQSIVHSFVELADRSVLAQLGPPDMRTPIQVALTWPTRCPGAGDALDLAQLGRLAFAPPDTERFPALALAYRVIRSDGHGGRQPVRSTAGAVLNAANEAAVAAFLEHRIRFGRIVELAEAALDALPASPVVELADALEADRRAREFVAEQLASASAPR